MKKSEFIKLLKEMIKDEASEILLHEASQFDLYRWSRLHPINITRRRNAGRRNPWTNFGASVHDLGDTSSAFGKYQPGYNTLSGKEILPDHIREYLKQYLVIQKHNPTALKILNGYPITKKEAGTLAKVLVAIPDFLMKQPRNVTKYLLLMVS